MNIISNTCVGAGIYETKKEQFKNPFMWNVIDFQSMYNLIKNYDTINFENIELQKDNNWKMSIIIDNQVKVNFVHYKFSINDKTPKKIGVDVFYNKIWEYVINKYTTRIDRLLKKPESPIFIIGSVLKHHWYNIKQVKQICNLNSPYKIIFANNNIVLPNYNNIIFHKYKQPLNKYFGNNSILAKEIVLTYKDIFK